MLILPNIAIRRNGNTLLMQNVMLARLPDDCILTNEKLVLTNELSPFQTLRREHDTQIVQIATEAGLRIAPDQWSSLLYAGDDQSEAFI